MKIKECWMLFRIWNKFVLLKYILNWNLNAIFSVQSQTFGPQFLMRKVWIYVEISGDKKTNEKTTTNKQAIALAFKW